MTGPNALSTEDLTGQAAGLGQVWTCTEIPIGTVAKYSTKVWNVLERLGFFLFG